MNHNDYKFQLELTDDQIRLVNNAMMYWETHLREIKHDVERGVPIIVDYDNLKKDISALNDMQNYFSSVGAQNTPY